MRRSGIQILLFLLMAVPVLEGAGALTQDDDKVKEPRFSILVHVMDQAGKNIPDAAVLVEPYGVWGVTGEKGEGLVRDIPFNETASYHVYVSVLGYKDFSAAFTPLPGKLTDLECRIEEESISMKEVVVVAENGKSGESTASKIGRQAIDHLQATSLRDLLQLLPGQVSMRNPSLTGPHRFSSRTLYSNDFGAGVIVDGVPCSVNSDFEGDNGIDLRSIGTDDLQSVEIIRGIPSAEYGDISSGTMLVNSKIGITDLNVRAKIMPGIMQFSAGKGFRAGKSGDLNLSADYAYGKSDPRYRTDTYHRILGNVTHSTNLCEGRWNIRTKVSFTATDDWSGPDPDEAPSLQKYFEDRKGYDVRISHSGRISLNRKFAGTLKYDLSYSNNTVRSRSEDLRPVGGGAIFDAVEDGMYPGKAYPMTYETITGVKSNPVNYYVKVSDLFQINAGRFFNRFNVGADFRSEGNEGTGRYDAGEYPAFAQARTRRFCDIPYLNQFSIYAEDRFSFPFSRNDYPNMEGQAGFRWTMIQPGRPEFKNSISPRINLSLNILPWLSVRGGYGQAEKLPSLEYLYPDKGYYDFYNISVSDGSKNYFLYSTRVFDLSNPALRPMRNTKWEAGLDFRLKNGMSFSVIGFLESVKNGFGNDNSEWVALQFNRWTAKDVTFENGSLVYDEEHPAEVKTLITSLSRPGNVVRERNRGIEFDFDFGKIHATGTSFYLNGAYMESTARSTNLTYAAPVGETSRHSRVYVVYPDGGGSVSERRSFTAALRIVQHIPVINFIISATGQFVFYDYDRYVGDPEVPCGYIKDDGHPENWVDGRGPVHYIPFTTEQLADPSFRFEGYYLKEQIFSHPIGNLPTIWPMVWTMNLRITKEFNKVFGFSFYANNVFFHQPWQTTNTSTNPVERNGTLFSYGLELFLHF